MESPARRSAIPVSTSTPGRRNMSRSMSRSNENLLDDSDPVGTELRTFTLLEENIALKETRDSLVNKNVDLLQKHIEYERLNKKLLHDLEDITQRFAHLHRSESSLREQQQLDSTERETLRNVNIQQKKVIDSLMVKVRDQELRHSRLLKASQNAKTQLQELVPDARNDPEDTEGPSSLTADTFANQTMEKLVNDIGSIRAHLNSTELQLYEANEKIAELLEIQHQTAKENETLHEENANLNRMAQLMTSSMRDSVDTSKKMEGALLRMRRQHDVTARSNHDSLDSPGGGSGGVGGGGGHPPRFVSQTVLQLQNQLTKKDTEHTERIVEMTKRMEETIQTDFAQEIQVLQLKLEVVERELALAVARADAAEDEVRRMQMDANRTGGRAPPSPPAAAALPPPPPPPMPTAPMFSIMPPAKKVLMTNGQPAPTLYDQINGLMLNERGDGDQQVGHQATGMDALIAELRVGSVTLRRNNRRKTRQNAALQEMFDVLEQNRLQNRNSKMLVDSEMRLASSRTSTTSLTLTTTSNDDTTPRPTTSTHLAGRREREDGEEEDTIFV